MRARTFVLFWFFGVAGILAYALLDLQANPWLEQEVEFTMAPRLDQAWDVLHWGGRLLRHRAWGLLVANAVILGGVIALVVYSLLALLERLGRRTRHSEAAQETIVVVADCLDE